MSGKVRKYLLPNIPYLFMLWVCVKLGTAYRLAEGANFVLKLVNMGQTIGPVFQTPWPGLNGADWLIGILGAAALWLTVYTKTKEAKKYRQDEEYGSSRWEIGRAHV